MAKTASDVLAVLLLMRECGMSEYLRVVPLFETLDDLTGAPGTMKTLFQNSWYLGLINGVQECMIGEPDGGGGVVGCWDLERLVGFWSGLVGFWRVL
jgi:phosphoenolpyruvate carboxylase